MRKLWILVLPFLLLACENSLLPEEPGNSPLENFNSMVETVGYKYSFFELKNINWEQRAAIYRNRLSADMSDEDLFTVLDSLLYELRDGHVNLSAPFNLSRNWSWYLNSPDNFNDAVIERDYLADDYRYVGGFRCTYLRDSIAYLHYSSFSASFSEAQIESIFEFIAPAKGLILDLRNNGGGSLNNTYRLAGRFSTESFPALIVDEKTGPGPNDFGNTGGITIPAVGDFPFLKPVVLLTNRRCYSATNTFTAITKSLDQFYHLGDTTGGGGGIPIDYELPNGWRYRFSATRSFTPDGFNIELGLPPDSAFNLDESLLQQGVDQYIEAALDRLD